MVMDINISSVSNKRWCRYTVPVSVMGNTDREIQTEKDIEGKTDRDIYLTGYGHQH